MTTYEKIDMLRLQNSIVTIKDLEEKIGIANGTIGKWKYEKNKPSFEVLIKIADYFKVGLDYLCGLPQTEIQNLYDSLSPKNKERLIMQAKNLKLSENSQGNILENEQK